MKKKLLVVVLSTLFSAFCFGQTLNLPVNFENSTVNYYGLTDFGGNVSEIVIDPTNSANHVVKTTKTLAAELWAGTTVGGTIGFATPIPFAAGSTSMSVKVWSPTAGTPIRLKVENAGNPTISVETEALTTVASAWQTLIFNFSNQASGTSAINFANTYNKASIFFNFGTTGAIAGEKIYFWDDMEFVAGPPPPVGLNLPVNFEDTAANYYGLTDFGGNVSEIVVDPTNATNRVVKTIKTAAAELWAGTTVGGTVGFTNPIPFVTGSTSMSVKVWSPTAGTPIRLKVENSGNAAISVETEALTTVASAWQTLIFNFSNQASGTAALNLANSYNKASIFFNFGTTGTTAGEKIYFWDDMEFVAGPPPPVGLNLPVNFEDTAANYYGLTDFGGNVSEIVVDPTNATNRVVKTIKTSAAELWAGTTVGGTVGFTNPIPFVTGSTSMSVKVWSPTAGTPIRLKVENSGNAAISVETEALTTVASAWQTLIFNFSNQASGTAALNLANSYNKASIFFNFGTTGTTAGEKIYFWDDMEFVAGPPPPVGLNLPVNFEDTAANYYGLTDFGGNASEIVVDPTSATNHVVKTIKTAAAELWAGTTVGGTVGFANPIPFVTGSTSMRVKVWSPTVGTPIRLKVENSGNAAISVETEALTTAASAWQTLVFDFSNHASGTAALNLANSYNKASIFFNFGTTGVTAGEKTYYWDDMEFATAPPPPGLNLPVNFEDTIASIYGITDFGGNVSEIVVDPTNTSNHVVKTIKTAGAELWAGTTMGGTAGFANPVPFAVGSTSMSVRVWSPTAGTPIRLKVEKHNDPTISVETEALTTVASGWQTLAFNFSNQAAGTAALNLAHYYNKSSIFFNFGTTGAAAGEQTYYWDNMEFGNTINVTDIEQSNISVFPNPAENSLYINSKTTLSKVTVFNVVGKQIKEFGNELHSINVSELTTGVYIIKLTDINGKTLISKFIKK